MVSINSSKIPNKLLKNTEISSKWHFLKIYFIFWAETCCKNVEFCELKRTLKKGSARTSKNNIIVATVKQTSTLHLFF